MVERSSGPRTAAALVLVLMMTAALLLTAVGSAGAAEPHVRADPHWIYRGVSVIPSSPSDLSSRSFDESVLEAKRDGANTISIVIQYYQQRLTSSTIRDAPTTPSDRSLRSAIAFIHARRMKVAFKVFFDVDSPHPPWRWYINPRNRPLWFRDATRLEVGLARLHPDLLIIGTEDGRLSVASFNRYNTTGWIDLIESVRRVYKGLLTYEAQTPSGPPFGDEADEIGFWSYLSFATVSGYNSLSGPCDATVARLERDWSGIAARWYEPLERLLGAPIVFGEAGYSSYACDIHTPYQYYQATTDPVLDLRAQSVAYQAFLKYWSHVPYVSGIIVWNWLPDPDAGGPENLDYTPQNKPAEAVLRASF